MISSAKVRSPAIEAPGAANSTFSTPPASSRFSRAMISSGVPSSGASSSSKIVGIVLDVVIALGAGAAREVADILQAPRGGSAMARLRSSSLWTICNPRVTPTIIGS